MRGRTIAFRRPGATARARNFRREDTDAEYRLWCDLRGRRLGGHKFIRQVPLGPYTVDFLCRTQRLVVELDGQQHAWSASDEVRTAYLNANGYAVLRFWNHEVLRERDSVLDAILAVSTGRITGGSLDLRFAPATLTRSAVADSTSPVPGEEGWLP